LRRITGRHNPLLKELRRAFSRGELTEEGDCAVEGVRIVEEAIRSGLRFRAVFFSESATARADRLLPQLGAHVETLVVPDSLFSSSVPSETPQGVAALVRPKAFRLEDIVGETKNQRVAGPSPLVLAVAGLQDPGNLGTLIRSAEAFGATGVLLGEKTVSPFNSKVIRASAGSVFRLPLVREPLGTAVAALRDHGIRLLATSSHKGTPIDSAQLDGPIAVFIGSEGAGLPREVTSAVDEMVAIPHSSKVESLNAAVAASIVLYETARQRRSGADTAGSP
jgi:TrmH family RNA methyltransferase